MKKYIVSAVAFALAAAPAGFAFADEQVNVGTNTGVHMDSSGDNEMDSEHGDASSSLELGGGHEGMPSDASTSMDRGDHEDQNGGEHTSSTKDHKGDNNNQGENDTEGRDGNHSFVQSFLAWLFAQPASTTVGQIQNQLQASTTASTSVDFHGDNGNHEGFFARLFGFFGFGGRD